MLKVLCYLGFVRYSAQFCVNESVANPCQAPVRFGLGWFLLSMDVILTQQIIFNVQKVLK
jgi:hypothetical protein